MVRRKTPPGRRSTSQPWVLKPSGPHQRTMCSGRVQARNTSRGGAAKWRVTTTTPIAAGGATASRALPDGAAGSARAVTAALDPLQLLQVLLEPVEALLPEAAI